MKERSKDIPPLEYATPKRPERSARSAAAIVFGVMAGLFGALMLFYGVEGIVWLVRDWKRVDDQDVVDVVVWNIIGLVCAYAAWRWIAGGARGFVGSAGR
jgi:hypothetical protein